MCQSLIESGGVDDLLAIGQHQFTGEPRRRRHRNLLPENGAHGEFKSVPRARNPERLKMYWLLR